jgi:hypothetical protein
VEGFTVGSSGGCSYHSDEFSGSIRARNLLEQLSDY